MASNELLNISVFLESLGEISGIAFETNVYHNGIIIVYKFNNQRESKAFKEEISKIIKGKFSNASIFKDRNVVTKIKFGKNAIEFSPSKKIKKKPKTGGGVIDTKVQEKGTTFVFNQVLHKNKNFKSEQDILSDKETYNGLIKIFKGYEDRLPEWTHSYYEQQKEFLKKFSNSKWDEFEYGGDDFVTFFTKNIKMVAESLDPLQKVSKYTDWNPSDIWAVYDMNSVKKDIKNNITPATQNVVELNNLLIQLFEQRRLVGLSLKKIAKHQSATLKFVNISPNTKKFAEIESYKMSDIKFDFKNIFEGEKVTTYVKYGKSNDHSINITKSNNNLSFNTAIKKTPAAQGGQANIKFLLQLINRNGRSSYSNDHRTYPSTSIEFIKRIGEYEKMYEILKKFDSSIPSFSEFKDLINLLYNDKKTKIAILKLMTLHFFSESIRLYSKDREYWTDLLYTGMKVGSRFAPHAKIS